MEFWVFHVLGEEGKLFAIIYKEIVLRNYYK
jgi:hypothetical protein